MEAAIPEPCRAVILEGDCLDRMREMEADSVDSMVSDPPSGISFMNAKWDSDKGSRNNWIAWLTEVMEEAHRVMKPGAHGLVWALPRTSHWTAMALEDAGFDVRERITHHFGSGFPKNHDVGKAVDKLDAGEKRRERDLTFTAWMRSTGITTKQINEATESCMGSHYLTDKEQPAVPTVAMLDKLRPLLTEVPEWVEQMAQERTIESDNFKRREVIGKSTNGLAPRWVENGDAGFKPEFDLTAPATDEARKWEGFGTALKPATEDWWLIRKPLSESSIARNVLKHGCGAINVDASRISGSAGDGHWTHKREIGDGNIYGGGGRTDEDFGNTNPSPAGRFPANLILSHSPECRRIGEKRVKGIKGGNSTNVGNKVYGKYKAPIDNKEAGYADPDGKETVEDWECTESCPVRILGEQSGESKSPKTYKRNANGYNSNAYGNGMGEPEGKESVNYGDSGGASRFFMCFKPDTGAGFKYQSKASKRDRSSNGAVENIHPTTKSTSLMAYLVRMVTPPGGTVLDPFAGSGSTLVAAIGEGFDCIGIEAEPEYATIARKRIAHCTEDDKLF